MPVAARQLPSLAVGAWSDEPLDTIQHSGGDGGGPLAGTRSLNKSQSAPPLRTGAPSWLSKLGMWLNIKPLSAVDSASASRAVAATDAAPPRKLHSGSVLPSVPSTPREEAPDAAMLFADAVVDQHGDRMMTGRVDPHERMMTGRVDLTMSAPLTKAAPLTEHQHEQHGDRSSAPQASRPPARGMLSSLRTSIKAVFGRTSIKAAVSEQPASGPPGSTAAAGAQRGSGEQPGGLRVRLETALRTTKLLAQHAEMPRSMARDVWLLDDYDIEGQLESGGNALLFTNPEVNGSTASTVVQAVCKKSGAPVALKVSQHRGGMGAVGACCLPAARSHDAHALLPACLPACKHADLRAE